MTSEETFRELYNLCSHPKNYVVLHMLDRYMCQLNALHEDEYRELPYFTSLSKDCNANAWHSYADLHAYDPANNIGYFGRLCMTVNDDLEGESKYSFMLYLKEHEDDKDWKTSIAIPTASIQILSSK